MELIPDCVGSCRKVYLPIFSAVLQRSGKSGRRMEKSKRWKELEAGDRERSESEQMKKRRRRDDSNDGQPHF